MQTSNNARNETKAKPREIEKNLKGKKLLNVKKRIPKTGAYAAIQQSTGFMELFGAFLGWKMSYDWKSGLKHWCTVFMISFSWSQFIYSQFKYFFNDQEKKIFEVFAVYGISVSCTLKFTSFVTNFKEWTALHKFSFKLCRLNSDKPCLEYQQLQNLKAYKVFVLLVLLSVLIYVFYPTKCFVINQELVPLLPIEIMFIDQSQFSGFLFANILMIVMGIYAGLGSLYISLHFVAVILNYSMQVEIIGTNFNELDELWRDTSTTSISERHQFLRNICQKCQDKDSYITEVKNISDNMIFLYFCFAYVSQILCLYMANTENWISGYGIACGLFMEMFFYCFVGTRTTIINERLCYIITQSNWYTYDMHSQKIILFLLSSCMNAKELWIGPLAPLSVFTGTEILKSIYSYYTILMEVM